MIFVHGLPIVGIGGIVGIVVWRRGGGVGVMISVAPLILFC